MKTVEMAREIKLWPLDDLRPYERNARTHSAEQVAKIAASIVEFGFTNPILIDGDAGIIAGHGRLMAARKLGLREVPVIELTHLSEAQKRAYILADNRLALDAGWNEEMLAHELDELRDMEFDLSLTGFDDKELADLIGDPDDGLSEGLDEKYTKKITIPVYEPKGEKPEIKTLTNGEKAAQLIDEIMAANISEEEKEFLIRAAQRHIVFDYHSIAEYYCHASPEMQELMEKSALVLIDFDKAVENGYVLMSKKLEDVYSESYGDDAS